jgi:hypothetical protein
MVDRRLELVATSTATTYRFRSPEPLYGWACCTVNDSTGELTITSDWGNWGHRWNTNHLGLPSLTEFIADRTACDYLAGKLVLGDGRRFSAEKTTAALRRLIVERRRDRYDGTLTRDVARELWDELGNLEDDCGDSCDLYFERLPADFIDLVCSEPWHYSASEPTPEYRQLVGVILPALVEACRAEVARRAAAGAPRGNRCTCDNALGSSTACRGTASLGAGWYCALTGDQGCAAAAPPEVARGA